MRSLRIEIGNERLLPRFGVDRILILLAKRLSAKGHEVRFVCLRCDRAMLLPITGDITVIEVPEGSGLASTETLVAAQMRERWQHQRPDAVVIGGWPFFECAAQASAMHIGSVLIAAGAVPQNGLTEPMLTIQEELRRLHQRTLPLIDRVLPISDFVRFSQSEPDRGFSQGVRTVLLGADHMGLDLYSGEGPQASGRELLARLDMCLQAGEHLLLALGRFEKTGYKNSPLAFDLLRQIRKQIPQARLLLLDANEECNVPADLNPFVYLLGSPGDSTLQAIMIRCAAGVSMSCWEGFNLPVAEMQWLERPVLAFNVAAHPEVIADPWLLCDSLAEMTEKAVVLLEGKSPIDLAPRLAAFCARRQWADALDTWEEEVCRTAGEPRAAGRVQEGLPQERRLVLVDVTHASLDPANPGVIRVARRLSAELQQDSRIDLVFAAWDRTAGDYVFLNAARRSFLQGYGGPEDGLSVMAESSPEITPGQLIAKLGTGRFQAPVLFLPEVLCDGQAAARLHWGRARGFRLAAILHDLIAVFHKELCDPAIVEAFPGYLKALSQADAVWSNSDFTRHHYQRYAAQNGQTLPAVNETIWLPGQLSRQRSNGESGWGSCDAEIRILCVSTLEPRKNHLRLLEAFQRLRDLRPELALRLVLLGNRYAGAPEIAEQVQRAAERDPQIEWDGFVDDNRLVTEFQRSAFTVYPSCVEGFGLPILESLWMGRPCLTHNDGVMRELAASGGCMTVNINDRDALLQALARMATDRQLLERLRKEALERHIATWQEYAHEIAERLLNL
jgi:glycosyltransferase involved in cell wall biosynthesis